MVSEKKPTRPNLLPLILIAVGVLMLIANIGWLSWGALLGVLNLWPVVLIAIGADILSGGKYRLVIVLATLAVGALVYTGATPLSPQPARTETVEQVLGEVQQADIAISSGVSELRVHASDREDILIEGTVQARRGERIVQNADLSGGTATFELTSEQSRTGFFDFGSGRHAWDLAVTNEVPLELTINTGVGRADLDLSGLQLRGLDIDTGVGETVLTLPDQGSYKARLDTGVGAATIRIPEGVAARVTVDRGVGSVDVSGNFLKNEDTYTSSDYATAEHKVDLEVSSGVGAVTVESNF